MMTEEKEAPHDDRRKGSSSGGEKEKPREGAWV
jgi:hypothetical protein